MFLQLTENAPVNQILCVCICVITSKALKLNENFGEVLRNVLIEMYKRCVWTNTVARKVQTILQTTNLLTWRRDRTGLSLLFSQEHYLFFILFTFWKLEFLSKKIVIVLQTIMFDSMLRFWNISLKSSRILSIVWLIDHAVRKTVRQNGQSNSLNKTSTLYFNKLLII